MLSVTPADTLSSAEVADQITWSFNSGSEFFDYLAAGDSLTLTYTVRVTDNNNATDDHTITIVINDEPVLSAGGSLAYTENGPAAAIDPALTVVGGAQLTVATIAIQSPVSGDVLAFSNDNASMGAITGSYDPATGILTLSGTATPAEYQAALRSVAFFSTSDDPTADPHPHITTISWQVSDADSNAAGAATSADRHQHHQPHRHQRQPRRQRRWLPRLHRKWPCSGH